MIYRLPELSDKEILMDYVSEHRTNGENSISASVGMLAGEFSDWVNKIHKNAVFEADNYNEGRISQYYTVDLQML